jgi:hypothetical protein
LLSVAINILKLLNNNNPYSLMFSNTRHLFLQGV